jgi:hypothetical protein
MMIDDNTLYKYTSFFTDKNKSLTADDVYAFFAHEINDIANFICGKGLVSFPLITDYQLFQPLLSLHLLTSNHTCLCLPPADEQHSHFVKIWRARSTYDNMGCDFESVLNFGKKTIVDSFLRDGQFLLQKGVLSLIPSNSVDDRKGYGAPEPVCYRRHLLTVPLSHIKPLPEEHASPHSNEVREIIFPTVYGVKTPAFLKLISDEWGAFERCRDRLIYSSIELSAITDDAVFDSRFRKLKKEIIDDGIYGLDDRMKSLNRKGLIKAIGGVLGSASLFVNNVIFTGSYNVVTSLLAASILGTSTLVNHMEYNEGIRNVARDPFYFLWKMKKAGE